jgi:predicted peroxiredoxin
MDVFGTYQGASTIMRKTLERIKKYNFFSLSLFIKNSNLVLH